MTQDQRAEVINRVNAKLNFHKDERGEMVWDCQKQLDKTRESLRELGIDEGEAERFGQCCDCEIVFNCS